MTEQQRDLRPHFILSNTAKAERFRSPLSGGVRPPIPELDHAAHGASLLSQVQSLKSIAEAAKQAQQKAGLDDGFGLQIQFPLLSSALAAEDQHSIEPGWGTADEEGHGTQMAGLALFGDLTATLSTSNPVKLLHCLESVKLLRKGGDNKGKHHGYLTVEAVARTEVGAPERNRVFSMAVTADDSRDHGRPSAWSAAIDNLTADLAGEGLSPRLIVISAGNTDTNAYIHYPDSNSTDSIHDPSQAWNALTVEAYTEKATITESDAQDYTPIAPMGGLSPFSTTSVTWERPWPLKPDVLFEGGNAAKDSISASWMMHSLSLLTTHHALQAYHLSVCFQPWNHGISADFMYL